MARARLGDFSGGLFAGGQKGPQPISPKEANVSKSIEDFLNKRGIYNDRLNSGMIQQVTTYTDKKGQTKEFRRWIRLAKRGSPDRWFLMGGRMFLIEVKRKGKKPTPEQLERHDELRRAGAYIFNVDSIDEFRRQFNERFQLGG
jgi:hypothetical protein